MPTRTDCLHANRSYDLTSLYYMHLNCTGALRDLSIFYDNDPRYSQKQVFESASLTTMSSAQPKAKVSTPSAKFPHPEKRSAPQQSHESPASTSPRHQEPLDSPSHHPRNRQTSDTPEAKDRNESMRYFGNGLKRQHTALIMDEELNCMLEDRAGTPHVSEFRDEEVLASLNTEELGIAGAMGGFSRSVAMLREEM
jgi:hypothetical protein